MSSIHGIFLKLAGLDKQSQAGRAKNAKSTGPLSGFNRASLQDLSAAPKKLPVSRHDLKTIALAGQEEQGVKRYSTSPDADPRGFRKALVNSLRL